MSNTTLNQMPAVNLGASDSRPKPSSSEAADLVELRVGRVITVTMLGE